MIAWRFDEALSVDTHQAATRWWTHRCPIPEAPLPSGLIEDFHTVRLTLDENLQRRHSELATFLPEPRRTEVVEAIAELDPWRVLSERALRGGSATAERQTAEEDDQDLLEALKERARRRERLECPRCNSNTRRRLRDLARGRGGTGAILNDEDACKLLRFGAILCDLITTDSDADAEPAPHELCARLAELSIAEARRAARAVLNDPLVGGDARGRPAEREITEFVRSVVDAVERRVGYRLKATITRSTARSPNWDDLPGPDIELILDLLACHAPSKTAEAISDLIKAA
jgi:hypothetical protein